MKVNKITIVNRLKRTDSITGMDVLYNTILTDIDYHISKVTVANGTSISMGQEFIILIPFTNKYLPYPKWIKSDRTSYFTMSQGDYIFIGEVDEDITLSNIVQLKNKYSGMCCEVRSVTEAENKLGTKVQLKVSGV